MDGFCSWFAYGAFIYLVFIASHRDTVDTVLVSRFSVFPFRKIVDFLGIKFIGVST